MSTATYERLNRVGAEVYNEKGDCSVIAVAVMANVSYGKAQAALKRAGRKPRHGAKSSEIEAACNELMPAGVQRVPVSPITIKKAADATDGRAIFLTSKHAAACVDGIVHDYTQGRRHRVKQVIVPRIDEVV